MLLKLCTTCNIEKSIDSFHKRNKKRKDGSIHVTTQHMCKTCSTERRKKYYQENIESETLKKNQRAEEIRQWFLNIKKTYSCSVCKDSRWYVLDFHHIDDNKEHNLGDITSGRYGKTKILNELKKCVPLCANCHREHHYLEKMAQWQTGNAPPCLGD